MRVAKHHDIRVVPLRQSHRRRTPDLVTMADVHPNSVERDDYLVSQLRITRSVGVTEHRFDRRNQPELGQDARAADVAGMKNELYPSQSLVHTGAQ